MDDREGSVIDYLTARGLIVQHFEKAAMRQSPIPDFWVLAGDQLAFYCEVKTAQEDHWLERQFNTGPPRTQVGGARPDPTYNRISNYIHRAVVQFDAVNLAVPPPKCWPSSITTSTPVRLTLLAVVTGNAHTASGPIRMFGNFSYGRIRKERERIDLYLWFDRGRREPFKWWTQSHPQHHAALCGHLGIDPRASGRFDACIGDCGPSGNRLLRTRSE